MASITKAGKRWRAQVFVRGARSSKVCETRARAAAWALEQEAELAGDKLPDKTFGEALERYAREVAPLHRGCKWEQTRLAGFGRHALARKRLLAITGADIVDWRDGRLRAVAPASVLREMKLMRAVFESCRRDFGWLLENPMRDVTRPQAPPSRKRRVTADEIDRLMLACGLGEQLAADTATQMVGLAFLLGLETAMRAGELLGLHAGDVDVDARVATLPKTKNGDAREVPLSSRAVEILRLLPVGDGPLLALSEASRDALFRKMRKRAGLEDLHFHDSRAEAIWRLSKKFDVLQLARVIGHRDLKSLLLYYNDSAAELAKRLA